MSCQRQQVVGRPVMEGWWFVVLSSTVVCHMALWDISNSAVQFWHGNGNL